MKHSKDAVIEVAGNICNGLIEIDDIVKELGMEGEDNCEDIKYRLANIVAMARLLTVDISENPFDDVEEGTDYH